MATLFLNRDGQFGEEYTDKIKRMFDEITASNLRLLAEDDNQDYRENELKFEQRFTLLSHYLMQDHSALIQECTDTGSPLFIKIEMLDSSRFC